MRHLRCAFTGFLFLMVSSCLNIGSPQSTTSADENGSTSPASTNASTDAVTSVPSGGPQGPTAQVPTGASDTNSATSANTTVPPPAPKIVTGLDRYTLVGRFDTSNPNALMMYYLSSKIGASFTGTSLAVNLQDSGTDGLNIVIDDKALTPLQLAASSMTTYPLATGLAPGLHTVWITKRDEFNQGFNGFITFGGFVIDNDANFMTPPPAKTRRIEAVGDSSSAGYGVECMCRVGAPGFAGYYTPKTQNADLAIPALVAKAVDAEIVNVSWSGKGVAASQFDSNPSHMLPVIYPYLYANYSAALWDFNRAIMDVVLISAGADDLIGSNGSGSFADPNKFISTYANWLTTMRKNYPRALLVAIMSPNAKTGDRVKLTQALSAAVSMAAAPNQDANMMFFDFFANDPNGWTVYDDVANTGGYGWGCNYHTSTPGSQFLADRLTTAVKSHMGW